MFSRLKAGVLALVFALPACNTIEIDRYLSPPPKDGYACGYFLDTTNGAGLKCVFP